MGPNLLSTDVGAVLQVQLDDAVAEARLAKWAIEVQLIAAALGWPDVQTRVRRTPGHAELFLSAPIDQLMTATDMTMMPIKK